MREHPDGDWCQWTPLIAAAPELLEALLSCVASLSAIAEGRNISMAEALGARRKAETALAKAKGEQK